jgi:quinone-reactive Ni/Fe-hydrogenase small subunit
MRAVIVGGGIAAAYMANALLEKSPQAEVLIVSNESFNPYDRIHLCSLVDGSATVHDIALELDERVRVELEQKIVSIDPESKRIFSEHASYAYDKLIIATGSKPRELFDISDIDNATTFRSAKDSFAIAEKVKGQNVVLVGTGPIGLELLDTLTGMTSPKSITLLSRSKSLYSNDLTPTAVELITETYEKDERVRVLFNDEIVDRTVEDGHITKVHTKTAIIENPYIIFGVGIAPNVHFARDTLECDRGIVVDEQMQSSVPDIYAVGEAAQMRDGYSTGHVKECTLQADTAIAHIVDEATEGLRREVSIEALKVGAFMLADITLPSYNPKDAANEELVIASKADNRIDQYIINNERLVRFIGINSNIDLMALKTLMERGQEVDPSFFYSNRLESGKGKLVCVCTGSHETELVEIIQTNAVQAFSELKEFSEAGRVCGRCKKEVAELIAATEVDPVEAARLRAEREAAANAAKLETVRRRIAKFNTLHPRNQISEENLEEAMNSFDISEDYNRWVSMVTATMRLHPDYEEVVGDGVKALNKIPIIWLELADCSGNSEAFIKSAHPEFDELILNYISLDYHELLMTSSGDASENVLDDIIKNDAGKYILLVEGAIPLGLDGKFLRIGPKGETGLELLRRVAEHAAAVIAVGSCAFDGGVVAAAPNPTGAVGVSEALGRDDIINLPQCPVNPVNIVGTLLHYLMFEEFPELDEKRRPKWAYNYRIHDNCERRGHYDADEFVKEWGDEGAKKGWCLFEMGCKGPYADLNCSMVRFNEGTNWPVGVGHGCFACGAGKIAFDKYANNRVVEENNDSKADT